MVSAIVTVVLAIAIAYLVKLFFFSNPQEAAPKAAPTATTEKKAEQMKTEEKKAKTEAAAAGPKIITREEVSKHNTLEDLWVVIDNKVYNLTDYVVFHPGADAIGRNAGGDASRGFHGDQHPSRVWETLPDFYIGEVPENERTRFFTKEEFESLKNTQGRWVVVSNKVYDVSKWEGTEAELLEELKPNELEETENVHKKLHKYFIGEIGTPEEIEEFKKRAAKATK